MAALDPASGTLIDTQATAADSGSVSAVEFQSGPIVWNWSIAAPPGYQDNPPYLAVTEGSSSLSVAYTPPGGLFIPELIRYLDPGGAVHEVGDWPELPAPADSPEIIEVVPSALYELLFTLSVTASATGESASGSYTLRIVQDYDTVKDDLVGAVDARR